MGSFSKLEWMDAVRTCGRITPEQKLAIMDIGATANPDGSDAWRDNKSVAQRLGFKTVKTVTRARDAAIRCGLMVETQAADNRHTARYRLTMPTVWGDSTVQSNDLGGTPQSARGDFPVRLGGLSSPLGGTPQSPAMGISSVISSDSSSVVADGLIAEHEWQGKQTV